MRASWAYSVQLVASLDGGVYFNGSGPSPGIPLAMTLRAAAVSSECLIIMAFGNDLVGILHPLGLLVAVQPHALADDLKNIDDAKRPITFLRA